MRQHGDNEYVFSLLFWIGLDLSVPQVLLFSFLPSFINFVPPRRRVVLGWKFSVSDKMISYAIYATLAQFNPFSAVIGIVFGVLMLNWNSRIVKFNVEKDEVTGMTSTCIRPYKTVHFRSHGRNGGNTTED